MMDRRTRLLTAPVLPTLFRLAVPGIAAMMIMPSMSLVEAWHLGREGTVELAGVAPSGWPGTASGPGLNS